MIIYQWGGGCVPSYIYNNNEEINNNNQHHPNHQHHSITHNPPPPSHTHFSLIFDLIFRNRFPPFKAVSSVWATVIFQASILGIILINFLVLFFSDWNKNHNQPLPFLGLVPCFGNNKKQNIYIIKEMNFRYAKYFGIYLELIIHSTILFKPYMYLVLPFGLKS